MIDTTLRFRRVVGVALIAGMAMFGRLRLDAHHQHDHLVLRADQDDDARAVFVHDEHHDEPANAAAVIWLVKTGAVVAIQGMTAPHGVASE